MPLEVRQIGIRLNVGDGGQAPADERGDGGESGSGQRLDPGERAGIVEDCVEAVLTALRMQSER